MELTENDYKMFNLAVSPLLSKSYSIGAIVLKEISHETMVPVYDSIRFTGRREEYAHGIAGNGQSNGILIGFANKSKLYVFHERSIFPEALEKEKFLTAYVRSEASPVSRIVTSITRRILKTK